jgi:hypothetical protein
MQKVNQKTKNRIKRKNQTSRKRASKANKHKGVSFMKRKLMDEDFRKDEVSPTSKHIWPNQAMPKRVY